jgi:hypothetical protein
MGEQTSKKSGVKSTAQKQAEARHGFDQMPAASPVPGASGDPRPMTHTAEEVSFIHDTERERREDEEAESETGGQNDHA